MAIWRGTGGSGESTSDSTINITTQLATAAAASAAAALVSENAAEAAQAAAQTAETNAETAETNAETAETNAATSATNAASSATSAASSATSASSSASTATTKASEASASASAAATSASSASSSASTATTKAAEASTSATNAASSASSASTSATNAAASASSASTSASTATTQAGIATTQATAAASSAASAATSATTASTQASASSTSATNAASSASSAATSASTATTQASNAATSATNAATSASTATTQATNAAASASAASTSASSAATSASTATTQASNASTSATNAASSASSAASSAASAAAALDSFDDRYLGSKTSNPTLDNDGNALVTGALYYNSVDGEMRVYDGSQWIAASASSQAILTKYTYVATAGQTTFSGPDANALTLAYTVGSIIVTLNGVVLNGNDYTATTGTSVVLSVAASLNDELYIHAFSTFDIANTYTQAQIDAFAVKLTGNQTVAGVKTFSSAPVMGVTGLTGDIAADRITSALNATGSAPIYACRAWVNFNGTGTVAIRASGNVSSITDVGTGNYYVNFTTAMPDTNFSVGGVHNWANNGNGFYAQLPDSTANAKVQTLQSNANFDCTFVSVFVFR